MKIKKFFEPVYKFEMVFITDCTFDEANKALKKWGLPLISEDLVNTIGVALPLYEKDFPKIVRGYSYYIWVKSKKDFYCLLHEVTHMVIDTFENKGLTIDTHKSSQEAFAYYVEYWFKTLWRFMNESKVKKKKGGGK